MENFNKANIDNFVSAAYDEATENYPPIVVSVGGQKIAVPMFPETFENMELFLAKCFKILEEEYM